MSKITILKIKNVDYELSSNSTLEITETTTMQEVYDAAINGCGKLFYGDSSYFDILSVKSSDGDNKIAILASSNFDILRGYILSYIVGDPDSSFISNFSKSDSDNFGWTHNSKGNFFRFIRGNIEDIIGANDFAKLKIGSPEDNEDATTKLYVDNQIETLTNEIDRLTTQLTTLQNRFTPYKITNDTTYGELYDHLVETGYPIIYIDSLNSISHPGYFNVISYKKYNNGGSYDVIQLMFMTNDETPNMDVYFATNPSTEKLSEGIGIYSRFLIS